MSLIKFNEFILLDDGTKIYLSDINGNGISEMYNISNTYDVEVGDSFIGNNSHVEGESTQAIGENSHAEGRETKALGEQSHAEGRDTQAIGYNSHAEGEITQAIGNNSHAEGRYTKAIGFASHAEGDGSKAIGNNSHAEGYNTQAIGENSHAEGVTTQAIGFASHAEGYNNKAIGNSSHAEGSDTHAIGENSHAGGYKTKAGKKVFQNDFVLEFEDKVMGIDNLPFFYDIEYGQIVMVVVEEDNYPSHLNGVVGIRSSEWITQNYSNLVNAIGTYFGSGNINIRRGDNTPTIRLSIQGTTRENAGSLEANNRQSALDFLSSEGYLNSSFTYRFVYFQTATQNDSIQIYESNSGNWMDISNDIVYLTSGLQTKGYFLNVRRSDGDEQLEKNLCQNQIKAASLKLRFPSVHGDISNLIDMDYRVLFPATGKINVWNSVSEGFITILTSASVSGVRSFYEGGYTYMYVYTQEIDGNTCLDGFTSISGNSYFDLSKGLNANINRFYFDSAEFDEVPGLEIIGGESHAEGYNTEAIGSISHAEGQENKAIGWSSHAEGRETKAIGDNSHAEGRETKALGNNSHAEGRGTQAIGDNSHAEGEYTQAIGHNSHAEGQNTQAIGWNSHAEGRETKAIGEKSHAEGLETQAGAKKFASVYSYQEPKKKGFSKLYVNWFSGFSQWNQSQIEQTQYQYLPESQYLLSDYQYYTNIGEQFKSQIPSIIAGYQEKVSNPNSYYGYINNETFFEAVYGGLMTNQISGFYEMNERHGSCTNAGGFWNNYNYAKRYVKTDPITGHKTSMSFRYSTTRSFLDNYIWETNELIGYLNYLRNKLVNGTDYNGYDFEVIDNQSSSILSIDAAAGEYPTILSTLGIAMDTDSGDEKYVKILEGAELVNRRVNAVQYSAIDQRLSIMLDGSRQPSDLDMSFNSLGFSGPVYGMATQADGKMVLVGAFTFYGWGTVNAKQVNGIARLNADGTIDESFDAKHINPDGYEIKRVGILSSGKIVVSGPYNRGSLQKLPIFLLNQDGSEDTQFSANLASALSIHASAIENHAFELRYQNLNSASLNIVVDQSNRILLPYSDSDSGLSGIYRINADGTMDQSFALNFADIDPSIAYIDVILAPTADGKYLLGSNNSNQLAGRFGIKKINSDGSIDSSFQSGFGNTDNPEYTLINNIYPTIDGKYIVAGQFNQYDGTSCGRIVKIDADGTLVSSTPNQGLYSNIFKSIAQALDGKIYVADSSNMFRLNPDLSQDFYYASNSVSGGINGIKRASDRLFIFGEISEYKGLYKSSMNIVKIDPSIELTIVDKDFKSPFLNGGGIKKVLKQEDGKLILIGPFFQNKPTASGNIATASSIMRVNADGSIDSTFASPFAVDYSLTINAAAIQPNGKILVCVDNTGNGNEYEGKIIRLNSNGTIDASFDGSGIDRVREIIVKPNGKLLVAGEFTYRTLAGSQQNYGAIIRLNADGSTDDSFKAIGLNGNVSNMILQPDGKIMLGGNFHSLSYFTGETRPADSSEWQLISRLGVIRINSNGTPDESFVCNNYGNVYRLARFSDGKYIINEGKFNQDGTPDNAWQWGITNGQCQVEIDEHDRILLMAGYDLRRLNNDGSTDLSFHRISYNWGANGILIEGSSALIYGYIGGVDTLLFDAGDNMYPHMFKLDLSKKIGATRFITVGKNISNTAYTTSTLNYKPQFVNAFTKDDELYASEFVHRCLGIEENIGLKSANYQWNHGQWTEVERGIFALNDGMPFEWILSSAGGYYDSGRIAIDENDNLTTFKIDLTIIRLGLRLDYFNLCKSINTVVPARYSDAMSMEPSSGPLKVGQWLRADGRSFEYDSQFTIQNIMQGTLPTITAMTKSQMASAGIAGVGYMENFANTMASELNSRKNQIIGNKANWSSQINNYQNQVDTYSGNIEAGGDSNGTNLFIILPEEMGNISFNGNLISDNSNGSAIQQFATDYLNQDGTKQGLSISWTSFETLNSGTFYDNADTAADNQMLPLKYYDIDGNLQDYDLESNSPRTVIHLSHNSKFSEGTDGNTELDMAFSKYVKDSQNSMNWNWTDVVYNWSDADVFGRTLFDVYLDNNQRELVGNTVLTPMKWWLRLDSNFGDISSMLDYGQIMFERYGSVLRSTVVDSRYKGGCTEIRLSYQEDENGPFVLDTQSSKFYAFDGSAQDLINLSRRNTQTLGDAVFGHNSHAEGEYTNAIGSSSHAEGRYTQAIGDNSHAEGVDTQAIGYASHAEGQNTQAIGGNSHAEGKGTQAIGGNSHAEGYGTIAYADYQHASGKFNSATNSTDLFVIGNGSDSENRSDLAKFAQDKVTFNADTKLGAQPNTYAGFDELSLVTKAWVDGKVSSEISIEKYERNAADAIYLARAINAENSILESLSNESSRAQSAESSLEALIGGDLSNEIVRAQSSEASLEAMLNNMASNIDPAALDSLSEIVAAFQSADGNINDMITNLGTSAASNLSAEITRAESAEYSLAFDLSSEVSRAISVESAITLRADSTEEKLSTRLNIVPVVSSFTIGNGVDKLFTLNHDLGTMDVMVQIYDMSTGQTVETDSIRVDSQNVTIQFSATPNTDAYRVVTMGTKAFSF